MNANYNTNTGLTATTTTTAPLADTGRALFACITLAIVSITTTANANAAGGPVTISSAGGKSDGVGVADGRWLGQPSRAPNWASNQYRDYAVIDSQNNGYFWDINGANFGNTVGSVWVLDSNLRPLTNVKITYVTWTNTKIRVIPRGTDPNFRFDSGAHLAVSLDKTSPTQCNARTDIRGFPLIGIIQSRGYGQCTWLIGKTRLAAKREIPPTAYATTVRISKAGEYQTTYVPAQFDCLNYSDNHVGIITSKPEALIQKDGSIKWSFTVSEMNATWDEKESSSTRAYVIGPSDAYGRRKVVSGIGSNAGMTATGCFK